MICAGLIRRRNVRRRASARGRHHLESRRRRSRTVQRRRELGRRPWPASSADSGFINNGGISTDRHAFTGTVNNVGLGVTAAGTGTLTQTGGSITATGNATFGGNATGAGTYIMSGGTLNVTGIITAGSIAFGADGAGTANISGGWIAGRNVFLGANTHGHGHVVQTGGTLAVGQKLVMAELKPADFAATPTPSDYTMSAGVITVGGSMYVGGDTARPRSISAGQAR